MQPSKLPIAQSAEGVLSFSLEVAANTVAAVQIPLGGDTDFLDAMERRMQREALMVAEAHAARLAAEIAMLKERSYFK